MKQNMNCEFTDADFFFPLVLYLVDELPTSVCFIKLSSVPNKSLSHIYIYITNAKFRSSKSKVQNNSCSPTATSPARITYAGQLRNLNLMEEEQILLRSHQWIVIQLRVEE
jgi:hypothetical protein